MEHSSKGGAGQYHKHQFYFSGDAYTLINCFVFTKQTLGISTTVCSVQLPRYLLLAGQTDFCVTNMFFY